MLGSCRHEPALEFPTRHLLHADRGAFRGLNRSPGLAPSLETAAVRRTGARRSRSPKSAVRSLPVSGARGPLLGGSLWLWIHEDDLCRPMFHVLDLQGSRSITARDSTMK